MSHDADYLLALRLQSELDALDEVNGGDEIADVSVSIERFLCIEKNA